MRGASWLAFCGVDGTWFRRGSAVGE